MKSVALTAYPRELASRGARNQARRDGRVPAVMYGGQAKPVNLELKQRELELLVHHSVSENLLVDLTVNGQQGRRLALLQSIQHHALTGKPLHVDLHEVREDEKVTIMVPVESSGEAAGVKVGGGVLEHVLFKIKVRALPKDLPEEIRVDVSKLEIGQSLHLGEIPKIEGVEFLGDPKIPVYAVAAPLAETTETPAAEGAAATQPEMIKEKKDDAAAGKAPAGKAAPAGGDKKPADKKK